MLPDVGFEPKSAWSAKVSHRIRKDAGRLPKSFRTGTDRSADSDRNRNESEKDSDSVRNLPDRARKVQGRSPESAWHSPESARTSPESVGVSPDSLGLSQDPSNMKTPRFIRVSTTLGMGTGQSETLWAQSNIFQTRLVHKKNTPWGGGV